MRRLLAVVATVFVTLLACGGGSSGTPVASTPLAGTFNGQPWTAQKGRANPWGFDDGGERWIDIASSALPCGSFGGDPQIIGTIRWQTGAAYDLGLQENLTFVVQSGGTPQNYVATTGRVEVISAPDAGTGTVRLRAKFDEDFDVEGEIQLDVCD
jgi:hypothetical protein